MKHKLQLLLCFLFLGVNAFSQNIPSYVPTNGLVGYWPFNGNANDESGNGNHGTVNGATLTSDRSGVAGKAYSFDGISKIQTLSAGPSGTGISLSFWYQSSSAAQMQLISYGSKNWGRYFGAYLNHYSSQTVGPCYGPSLTNAGTLVNKNNSIMPDINKWHHAVIIIPNNASDLNSVIFYLDGQLLTGTCSFANYGAPSPNIDNGNPIIFGGGWYSGVPYNDFTGKLDEICFYNRALTQTEITALYNGPTYTITASSGSNGSITPSGITTLNSTSTQRYTYTANSGYMLDSVIVDGNKVDSVSGYTFSALTSNHTIRITYKALNIPSYVPTNGLVGWWPFNGNANDESGNGNHGIIHTGTSLSIDRKNNINSSYEIDGVNCFTMRGIELPAELNQNTDYSINIWFRSTDPNKTNQTIFNTFPHNVLDVSIFSAWPPINNTMCTWIGNGTYPWLIGGENCYWSFNDFTNWHHLVVVKSSTKVDYYIDNTLRKTQIAPANFLSNQLFHFIIGGININADNSSLCYASFKGSLDDIAIYNRALHLSEINALYNGSTSNYTITASSGSNGSISPSGITTFNSTATQRYTFTANSGYIVDSVIVDGNKVDSVSGYTFSSLTSNHTIRVTYKALNIPSYIPTNGLVGWWPFNGNANDESGNGNHGTVNGAVFGASNDINGIERNAYSFSSISDRILIPNVQCNNILKYSVTGWFRKSANQNYPNVDGTIFAQSNGCGGSDGLRLFIGSDNHIYFLAEQVSGTCNSIGKYSIANNYNDGKWHFFTIVYNGNIGVVSVNDFKIFVDNLEFQDTWQLGSTNVVAPIVNLTNSTTFGNVNTGVDAMIGSLDDIAIYNRALTQKEITALYTGVVTKDIFASSGANGSISPSGTTSVNSGSNQTYTFTPNSGYWIDSVIVNGVQVPTASSYTFNNVSSDQSIRVTYRSLAAALAAANICSNDTLVSTVNLPALSNVRATTYYSNIYLFNQNNTNNAYKYNVNDRKYTAITNKPSPCIECGVAEANGKIYCFNTNGTTEAYDIASNTWQNQANQTNTSSSSVYAASINNKIYILGYNNNQNTFTQYNPQTNSYSALANPTINATQSRLVAYNNKLYKIGGTDNNSQPISSVEVYNTTNNTWTSMPDLPVALTQVGATYYDNKLYVFGGKQANNSNSKKVYVFDFTSNAWYAESNTQNTNRTNIEAKTANNMVFLFGGTDTTNTQSNQAQRYFCKDQLCNCKWAEYVCGGVSSDMPCPTSSLYRPGTVFCNGYATKVVDVTNPVTGRTWMDRNLGATRAATSSIDSLAYGDLYQWGRGADGHQCRNSGTTYTLSTTDQPEHANFIIDTFTFKEDWRIIQNDSLWNVINGANNPCPNGYKIPSDIELENERASWGQNNNIGAYNSPIKLIGAGIRDDFGWYWGNDGSSGIYWTSSVINNLTKGLFIENGNSFLSSYNRVFGFSVRCIKD